MTHKSELLDVCIINELCIKPIFGIHDIRSDDRIDFTAGKLGIKGLEERCQKDCVAAIAC